MPTEPDSNASATAATTRSTMQSLTCDLDYSALTVAAEFTCSMTVAVMAACSVNRLGAGNNGVWDYALHDFSLPHRQSRLRWLVDILADVLQEVFVQ